MKNIFCFILCLIILNSCSEKEKPKWIFKSWDMIFPSYALAYAECKTEDYGEVDSTLYIGDLRSQDFSALLTNLRNNKSVTITLEETPYWEKSQLECKIPAHADSVYVYPQVVWKYDVLRKIQQPIPVSVTMHLKVDDMDLGKQTQSLTMRSIYECLYAWYEEYSDSYTDNSESFAAYVNEDHPILQEVLKEGLTTGIISAYTGYQTANDTDVYAQVLSIWNALQRRGVKYSSITTTSQVSEKLFSQRVRGIEDALKYSQANCVDGTVLLASLLRAIDIDPLLIKVPGHMFLGFYLDENHESVAYLETTMLGFSGSVNTDNLSEFSNVESYNSFIKALEMGDNQITQYVTKEDFFILDISEARKYKIKPIGL